jgi:MFS family permease
MIGPSPDSCADLSRSAGKQDGISDQRAVRQTASLKPLYLFIAISAATHFTYMGARLAVVLFAVHLQASDAVVGLLAALFGVLSAFLSVPGGRFMDRVGPARPMLACAIIMVAASSLSFFWPTLAPLFLVSTLLGTCYSLFFIGHTHWIGKIGAPEDRLKNINLASLGFSAATLVGPLSVGLVIDHFGHPAAFLMLARASLFPVAVLATKAIDAPPGRTQSERAAAHQGSVMQLMRDRRLRRIYGVSVMANATWNLVGFLVPLYGTQIGLSASTIGLILGAYSLASVVIRVFMSMLARRWTTWQLMIMSLAATGACFVVFPLVAGAPVLMALAFLIGLGIGLAGPLTQALLYDASPPGRVGEVMGLRVTAMNVTSTVVPLASGAVSAALGVFPVFWALAAVLMGGSYMTRAQWSLSRTAADKPSGR